MKLKRNERKSGKLVEKVGVSEEEGPATKNNRLKKLVKRIRDNDERETVYRQDI